MQHSHDIESASPDDQCKRRALQLIDRALTEEGGDRSRFIINAAYRRAEEISLDRCLFRVDEDAMCGDGTGARTNRRW